MARKVRVSFMSAGKKVFFMAKRGASAAYTRGKPVATRGGAFAYQQGHKAAQSGKYRAKAYLVRQRSLKWKVDKSAPKEHRNSRYHAPAGKCYACATCGRRYINRMAASKHVHAANHAYFTLVRQ